MNTSIQDSTILLTLNDENIRYENFVALENISLSIKSGEKIAIIGRSGAGKTTLLRRLFSLERGRCAVVHQHHALVTQLTTFHNIYMGRLDKHSLIQNVRNLIRPSPAILREIEPIAERLGISDKLYTRVGELSGGQQQRVGIGRAIYQDGAILLADEPVSSLDRIQQEEIMKLLVDAGQTIVAALHSIRLSKMFFNRVIGIKNRSILFDLPGKAISNSLLAELYG